MADSKWYSILTWSIRHVAYNLICGFLFASGLPITLRKTATKERKIGRQKERLLKSFIKNYWNAIKNMNPSISPIENKMAMVINSHYPVPFTLKQNVYTTIWAYRDYRDQNIYSPKNHFWISDGYLVAFRWIVFTCCVRKSETLAVGAQSGKHSTAVAGLFRSESSTID